MALRGVTRRGAADGHRPSRRRQLLLGALVLAAAGSALLGASSFETRASHARPAHAEPRARLTSLPAVGIAEPGQQRATKRSITDTLGLLAALGAVSLSCIWVVRRSSTRRVVARLSLRALERGPPALPIAA